MAAEKVPQEPGSSSTKSRKNRKKRSKASAAKVNGETAAAGPIDAEGEVEDESDASPPTPENAEPTHPSEAIEEADGQFGLGLSEADGSGPSEQVSNGRTHAGDEDSFDTQARLEAAVKERDQLRADVTELRKALEGLRERHEEQISEIKKELEASQNSKDHAEGRYQKLLGQVNTIKKQLGERLKADAEDLSQARAQIDELKELNRNTKMENESFRSQLDELQAVKGKQDEEITGLRGQTSLSQQNWAKERDDLFLREAQAREEFEAARQAMQDWEVLAMEERSVREGLSERAAELEEQLSGQEEALERANLERETQSTTIDGLQRALQEIQEARKTELREVVENSQVQSDELRALLKTAEESASTSFSELETARQELERVLPFEKEVKEKNLLIGKLRHEAVILNDHLTKALRFLKRGKPEDSVDRQLITNHFMHFVALDRSDPKKFQVLQLISALLGWTEEQNEAAGLSRPGASTQPINPAQQSSLRVPLSPFRRVSSSSSLSGQRSPSASMNLSNVFASPLTSPMEMGNEEHAISGTRSESLAELWSGFLEREAQEGAMQSRRTSMSTSVAGAPLRAGNGRNASKGSILETGGDG